LLNFATGAPFATGRARYFDHDINAPEGTGKVFVRISTDGIDEPVLAQLDIGAAWSVINVEIAEELGLLGGAGEVANLSTRHGPVTGRLENATITILADDGATLDIQATVFVSPDWTAPTFLGYAGLLERIRFGLDHK
jgi:hypothetical protein